jgi:hypothetical protein
MPPLDRRGHLWDTYRVQQLIAPMKTTYRFGLGLAAWHDLRGSAVGTFRLRAERKIRDDFDYRYGHRSDHGEIKAGDKPRGIAITPDARFIYVSDQPNRAVNVIDVGKQGNHLEGRAWRIARRGRHICRW